MRVFFGGESSPPIWIAFCDSDEFCEEPGKARHITKQGDKRAAAQRAFDTAQRLTSEKTATSLKSALSKYQQALELWHEVGDQRSEALTLHNIGFVYKSLNNPQEALDYSSRAVAIWRAVNDRSGEAMTLSAIALIYDSWGKKRDALERYTQVLTIYRVLGNRIMEAATLEDIAGLYDSTGEKQKALDFYDQTLSSSARWATAPGKPT